MVIGSLGRCTAGGDDMVGGQAGAIERWSGCKHYCEGVVKYEG